MSCENSYFAELFIFVKTLIIFDDGIKVTLIEMLKFVAYG